VPRGGRSPADLFSLAREIPELAGLEKELRRAGLRALSEGPVVISGAVGALPGAILALISESLPVLVIAADESAAETITSDAAAFGATDVCGAPEPSLTPYQRVAPSLKYRKSEFALLSGLAQTSCRIAAIPARFLFSRLPSPESFAARRVVLEKGKTIERGALLAYLAREGYAATDLVIETGDFAARGGIVDVFPADSGRPLRIELDGDEIASIRSFDPDTQRSEKVFERVILGPLAAVSDSEEAEFLLEEKLGRAPTSAEKTLFLPAVAGSAATIFDYAPRSAVVLVEPAAVEEAIGNWKERVAADYEPERDVLAPEELLHSASRLREALALRTTIFLDRLGLSPGRRVALAAEEVPAFDGRVGEAAAEIRSAAARGESIAVAVHPVGGPEKLRRFAREYELDVDTVPGPISAGFRLRESRRVLYSEEQIFGPERTTAAPRRRASEAFLSDLRDLKPGDFVVHVAYGVGRFRALRRIPVDGVEREFVEIAYVEDKTLLLPVERLDLVQKYSGAEGGEPRIDRLGSASWARKTAAAKKAVKDLSEDLLRIYARRGQATGFVFSKDSPWQKEFEDAFEHVETTDQAQAIADVKRDMERPSPMDRLLCGDVGYGKTEVAMRAAFKAVLDGKQVAVLAPTTILADQHYRTFTRRFAAFPVTIDLLSRFRDRPAQKKIVESVAEGTVDILIATHRLLSKDIRFRDLGLLVVDEEQRFGVAQKERIKEWKASVDVLSMSATPIPRSLNLSLSGLRDLSIIETPPRDRLAIETQIIPKHADLVKEAVAFELSRGGQVFYVHNRVESILAEKEFLSELLPAARIAIGHGQMSEGALEKTMLDFVARKSDILLATTIIENGIDIPSVNTILIDRADAFGLSQLYQLRGRVGRSDKAAYCYLVIEPDAALTETARQRLATIREFCDLGAGFRIAAKDLEIRGAGNFLGAEQSGHIAAVGLEMYLDLLDEAMRALKGEEVLPDRTVTISLGRELSIPPEYLPEESLRLALYKRIARAHDDGELGEIARETADRFGPPPASVTHLIEYGRLRRRAERLALKSIEKKPSGYRLVFDSESRIDPAGIAGVLLSTSGASISPAGVVSLPANWTEEAVIAFLDALLSQAAA
jgi:transcription-repair coupling factor (superfamily II helicase)